jgi:hypothetical protein
MFFELGAAGVGRKLIHFTERLAIIVALPAIAR